VATFGVMITVIRSGYFTRTLRPRAAGRALRGGVTWPPISGSEGRAAVFCWLGSAPPRPPARQAGGVTTRGALRRGAGGERAERRASSRGGARSSGGGTTCSAGEGSAEQEQAQTGRSSREGQAAAAGGTGTAAQQGIRGGSPTSATRWKLAASSGLRCMSLPSGSCPAHCGGARGSGSSRPWLGGGGGGGGGVFPPAGRRFMPRGAASYITEINTIPPGAFYRKGRGSV
jgi:hypothetical protein